MGERVQEKSGEISIPPVFKFRRPAQGGIGAADTWTPGTPLANEIL
jgi:hypothetical protein